MIDLVIVRASSAIQSVLGSLHSQEFVECTSKPLQKSVRTW